MAIILLNAKAPAGLSVYSLSCALYVLLHPWLVCLSVCLSVDNITQKVMNGLG